MVSTNESERLEQVFNLQDVGERQEAGGAPTRDLAEGE